MESSESDKPESKNPPEPGDFDLLLLIALWLLLGLAPLALKCVFEQEPGVIGDMFGMVNSLFSGLAFFYLVHTIRLQKHELELQRSELSMTREELAASARAQEGTAKALNQQVMLQAVSAQLQTCLERRKYALENLKERQIIFQSNPMNQVVHREIQAIQSQINNLTADIDRLHQRLVKAEKDSTF